MLSPESSKIFQNIFGTPGLVYLNIVQHYSREHSIFMWEVRIAIGSLRLELFNLKKLIIAILYLTVNQNINICTRKMNV